LPGPVPPSHHDDQVVLGDDALLNPTLIRLCAARKPDDGFSVLDPVPTLGCGGVVHELWPAQLVDEVQVALSDHFFEEPPNDGLVRRPCRNDQVVLQNR
jgi:hypothetical protein